jgi:hypothetical protein
MLGARTYGKLIISEIYMEKKTIQPVKVGGMAGGIKYIVNGCLFKFAVDHNGLYGNDDSKAAKVPDLTINLKLEGRRP